MRAMDARGSIALPVTEARDARYYAGPFALDGMSLDVRLASWGLFWSKLTDFSRNRDSNPSSAAGVGLGPFPPG